MGNSASDDKQQKGKLPFYTRDEDSEYSALGDVDKALKCSFKTRIIGFVVCCAVGWFLSILGTVAIFLHHNLTQFAILFSLGQALNITGSCFLAGPKKQVKNMVKRSRVLLTVLYLGLTLTTLILGLILPEGMTWLLFITLIGQVVSYFFYTLSYIPYGRKILGKCCKFLVD